MGKKYLFLLVTLFFNFNLSAYALDETWLDEESAIAFEKILLNISPEEGSPGAVTASPSKENPNYFYHWVRDAAIVMDVIAECYTRGELPDREFYFSLLLDFSKFSRRNQTTFTLSGLGEPKFHMNGQAMNDAWARPQNDGPALRSLSLIHFAQAFLAAGGKKEFVLKRLYDGRLPTNSVIKADLEYISHHWEDPCFDLWEEVNGHHFYTLMVQRRALIEGAKLASQLGDVGAARWYQKQSREVSAKIEAFWNAEQGLIIPTLDRKDGLDYKTSDLDSAIILGVLHGYTFDGFMSPSDDRILMTAHRLEEAFKILYPINRGNHSVGLAMGRYPEDRYFGGNAWVLTTLAFAEFYYRLALEYYDAGEIIINERNIDFFTMLLKNRFKAPSLTPGIIIPSDAPLFDIILIKLREYGDTFVSRIQFHALPDGSLSEQMDKETGFMISAKDLTWNYAAFTTAIWARDTALQNEP